MMNLLKILSCLIGDRPLLKVIFNTLHKLMSSVVVACDSCGCVREEVCYNPASPPHRRSTDFEETSPSHDAERAADCQDHLQHSSTLMRKLRLAGGLYPIQS